MSPALATSPELLSSLPHETLQLIIELAAQQRDSRVSWQAVRDLRLVCRTWRRLVDGSAVLAGRLVVSWSTHLGARLHPLYPTLDEFLTAVARVAERRAHVLHHVRLDMEAYGLGLAQQLLALPLPRLHTLALQNCEPQHLMALSCLPRLRALSLSRHLSGMVCPGPTAEGLLAQLVPAGRQLTSLELRDYRMLSGVVGSVADALPGLRHLSLTADRVEGDSCLDLRPLPRLHQLQQLELSLLGGRHSDEVVVGPLPPAASAMQQLTALHLAHVRAAERRALQAQQAQHVGGNGGGAVSVAVGDFWESLALLPALQLVRWEEQQFCTREPPRALLRLQHLRTLLIKLEGFIHEGDPPFSTWTSLPALPPGALPHLEALALDCIGLQALPPSWCARALTSLHISAGIVHRAPDHVDLPSELTQLAGSLRALELPACGLRTLPAGLAALTGLTRLDLSRNWLSRLPEPSLASLAALQEVNLFDTPVNNLAPALQHCTALRRLVVGEHVSRVGSPPGREASAARMLGTYFGSSPRGSSYQRSNRDTSTSSSSSSCCSMSEGPESSSESSGGSRILSEGLSWEDELKAQLPWVSQVDICCSSPYSCRLSSSAAWA